MRLPILTLAKAFANKPGQKESTSIQAALRRALILLLLAALGLHGCMQAFSIWCCCLVAKSCPTPFDLMDCSMPSSPVLHSLPEFAQIHVHWVNDAIEPSHPLPAPSPLRSIFPSISTFSKDQLFASGGQSIEASASVLPMNFQGLFPLGLTGLISLQSKELSRVFSSTKFESIRSTLSLLYGPILTSICDSWALTKQTFVGKWCLCFLIRYLGFS